MNEPPAGTKTPWETAWETRGDGMLLTPKQHEPEVIAAKIGGLAGGKRRGGASLPHEADFSHIVE
jgi:hypothetical protein